MQIIAAYMEFMLFVVAFGLSIICVGVFSIALCEGTSWIWVHLHSRGIESIRTIPSILSR
jgi:hypothetical protein